jgi:hypothetical protein
MFKTHRTFDLTQGVKNASIAVVLNPYKTQVIYHKTVVVTYNHSTDTLELDNGGWDTISTRAVINRALDQLPLGFKLIRNKKKETELHDAEGFVCMFEGYTRIVKAPAGRLGKYMFGFKKAGAA